MCQTLSGILDRKPQIFYALIIFMLFSVGLWSLVFVYQLPQIIINRLSISFAIILIKFIGYLTKRSSNLNMVASLF